MDSEDEDLIEYNYNVTNKYLHKLGNDYFNDGNYNDALIIYNKILDNIYDNKLISIIYSNKSACYLMLQDYLNSLNEALQSVQYNKLYAVAWGRVGWSAKKLKKYDEAINAFKIASKLNPYNLKYRQEIYYFNSKKIDKINMFDLFKSSDYIMTKLTDENFRNKMISNCTNPDNLLKDYEFIKLVDHIINKM